MIRGSVSSGGLTTSAQAVIDAPTTTTRRPTTDRTLAVGGTSEQSRDQYRRDRHRRRSHPSLRCPYTAATCRTSASLVLSALAVIPAVLVRRVRRRRRWRRRPDRVPSGARRFARRGRPGETCRDQLDVIDLIDVDDHDDDRSDRRRPCLPGRPGGEQLVHAAGALELPGDRHLRDAPAAGRRCWRRSPERSTRSLENTWDPAVGDPATRGGNAVSIVGDDGVRYYLAHFQLIDPAITPGARVRRRRLSRRDGRHRAGGRLPRALRPVAAVPERRDGGCAAA